MTFTYERKKTFMNQQMSTITIDLTKGQKFTLTKILFEVPYFDFYGEDYEVKTFKVERIYGDTLHVVMETGMKGDEGTFASILCRKYRSFFIGKNGGITYVSKKGAVRHCKVFELMNEKYNLY